jgi:hypothetical protein
VSTGQSGPRTGPKGADAAIVLAITVAVGIIAQSVLAGIFLAGDHHPHATGAHQMLGPLLLVPALASALLTRSLRSKPLGPAAFRSGIAVVVALALESGLGVAASEHKGLLALHIPVAVLLFGGLTRQISSLNTLRRG